jgi:hypothetical protein
LDVKVEGLEGQIGHNGILLRIAEPNGGAAIGRLYIGKATLRWFKGRTSKNAKQVSMAQFIAWLDSQ